MMSISYQERLAGIFLDAGGAVYNVRHPAFGASGDGKTNDAGAIQRAIDAVLAKGEGTILVPPGTYRLDKGLRVQAPPPGGHNISIVALGARLSYFGEGVALSLLGSGGGAGGAHIKVMGGQWEGRSADVGILVRDMSRSQILYADLRHFDRGSAIRIENDRSFCEQTLVFGCHLKGAPCLEFVVPEPNREGRRYTSFARTKLIGTTIGGGAPGKALIHFRGAVYDSLFSGVAGDMVDGAIALHLEGSMGGTVIQSVQMEAKGGSRGGYLLQIGDLRHPPVLVGTFPLRGNIRMLTPESGPRSMADLTLWGGLTLTSPGGIRYRLSVDDEGHIVTSRARR